MANQSCIKVVAVMVLVSVPSWANADVVTDWNAAALTAIRAGRTPPPRASRALAILHVSIYDAINGISRTHEPYRVSGHVPRSASREAAASAAAHHVLVTLFPTSSAVFDALHEREIAELRSGPQKASGLAWGVSVAREILLWRSYDGSDDVLSPPTGTGPGVWQPTPSAFGPFLLPQWGYLAPFAMPTYNFFRPSGPLALHSPEYAREYDEVKSMGAAVGSVRTAEQDEIALFWADGAGTETPPGHWNSIATRVSIALGNSLEENARLFALLNIAMADAAVCAWDAKLVYNFWRPITAIRNGDTDGNPATVAEASWSPFIVTPPFPDYVSGHSTFSGAAATILAKFYGSDSVAFEASSDSLPGVRRRFASFSDASSEAAISRLYGGIHFRSANVDGLAGGMSIGEWTFNRYLQPKHNRARDR